MDYNLWSWHSNLINDWSTVGRYNSSEAKLELMDLFRPRFDWRLFCLGAANLRSSKIEIHFSSQATFSVTTPDKPSIKKKARKLQSKESFETVLNRNYNKA